jgi:DUF971 family protein
LAKSGYLATCLTFCAIGYVVSVYFTASHSAGIFVWG